MLCASIRRENQGWDASHCQPPITAPLSTAPRPTATASPRHPTSAISCGSVVCFLPPLACPLNHTAVRAWQDCDPHLKGGTKRPREAQWQPPADSNALCTTPSGVQTGPAGKGAQMDRVLGNLACSLQTPCHLFPLAFPSSHRTEVMSKRPRLGLLEVG